MKSVKDKQVLVAADIAGLPLKDAVITHLKSKGWEVTDIGIKSEDDPNKEMFQRLGLRVGAKISEGEFEKALLFCGSGMGIHIAASKCPRVHSAVVESVNAAKRCVVANGCNVLSMGAYYVAPRMGIDIADAFLESNLGDGYENWEGFYDFHKFAHDELDVFDYVEFKKNGFEFKTPANIFIARSATKAR